MDDKGVHHPNITCPRCRARHPAKWTCVAAAKMARLLREKRAAEAAVEGPPAGNQPCPWCCCTAVTCAETSTYRWGAASCSECGAIGPEIRKAYGEPDADWHPRALAAWNQRKEPTNVLDR